ncbi:hypothetical protein BGX21_005177 [Mortierella sp. AD011]|nr:hypothetical protein BGX20_005982 [Mortierella sp. AD010]KAF9400011.1 hypothetical protein BGX21_005177 [Mortierella sp. AD011]
MSSPSNCSPVTQVLDTTTTSSQHEEKVSEEQFNSLHASSITYRDLLIFEERLKLNMNRLKKRQQKYEGMYSEKLGYSSKDNRPELSFFRKVPKKFQEGFSNYKANYIRRKTEKKAAALAARSGLGAGAAGIGLNRPASGQSRRLQPSSRGRRAAGGGGSASGSDSSARSSTRVSSLTAGDGARTKSMMMRPSSSSTLSNTSIVSASGDSSALPSVSGR